MCLLESFELGVHDVEFEQPGTIHYVVEVVFSEGDVHLVVTALPAGVAALVDDVRVELFIFAFNSLHLWNSKSDI